MRFTLLLFALSVLGIFCLAKGTLPPACTINPCKNGGICIPSSVGGKCRCVGPYTGMTCETAINACLSNPCLGGGTCAVGSQNRHWYCICPPGKTGLRCEKVIHDCSSQPCQNGGSCCESQSGYTCDCKPGFTGNYCETDIDECLSEPCQNGGTCLDQVNGYSCSCRVGLEGRHCERKKPGCHSNTCLNGGSCAESSDGMWYCICPKTYKGIQCEQQVNDCSSHPCQNGGSCCDKGDHYECTCPDGFTGRHCETELIVPSSTSTVTPSSSELIVPSSTFTVTPSSSACSCFPDHGRCVGGTCLCHYSYYGPRCEFEHNACTVGNPCGPNANCSKISGDIYTCITPSPVITSTPSLTLSSSVAKYCPCQNGGTCYSYPPHASCACPYPFTGHYCETHYCDIVIPCHNGGTCIKSPNAFTCICPYPFTGQNCQTKVSITPSSPSSAGPCPCQNGGTCITYSPSYSCSCLYPFTGQYCEITALTSTPPLTSTSFVTTCDCVPFHGRCIIRSSLSPSCSCIATGYYGSRCEFEHDPCTKNHCGSTASCLKLGPDVYTCVTSSVATTPTPTLSSSSSVASSPCSPNPCRNGGTCVPGSSGIGFYCRCPEGYRGMYCDRTMTPTSTLTTSSTSTVTVIYDHICDISRPCGQYGQCIKIQTPPGYRCQCYPGYIGQHCESSSRLISSTSSFSPSSTFTTSTYSTVKSIEDHICFFRRPCHNGGTCIKSSVDPGYYCHCAQGYIGPQCDVPFGYSTSSSISSSTTVRMTTTYKPSGFQTTILTTRSSSMSTVSSPSVISKRSKRDTRKNVEMTDVEDDELKRICKINERKARKFFSNNQIDKKNWNQLHPGIKAVLVDLVANNDHRRLSGTHAQIKDAVAGNDLKEMSRIMSERSLWKRVPVARYWKRKQMMKKAAKNPWSSLVKSEVVC